MTRHSCNFRYGADVDIAYARVSTAKQDLTRQLDALAAAGISKEHIFVDKKSGATTVRPGLQSALTHARDGDVRWSTPWTGWAGPSGTP
jgi:predicted site-specific integrase-resolvase